MLKYYCENYDKRLGGEFCEIYDENLKRIDVFKGVSQVDGLIRIGRKHSVDSALYEVEPLNDDFVILKRRNDEAVITAAEAFRGDK